MKMKLNNRLSENAQLWAKFYSLGDKKNKTTKINITFPDRDVYKMIHNKAIRFLSSNIFITQQNITSNWFSAQNIE